jgi:hypothetical protein
MGSRRDVLYGMSVEIHPQSPLYNHEGFVPQIAMISSGMIDSPISPSKFSWDMMIFMILLTSNQHDTEIHDEVEWVDAVADHQISFIPEHVQVALCGWNREVWLEAYMRLHVFNKGGEEASSPAA